MGGGGTSEIVNDGADDSNGGKDQADWEKAFSHLGKAGKEQKLKLKMEKGDMRIILIQNVTHLLSRLERWSGPA
jgi:hypothetical protein